jgi:hypothetical protein
MLEEHAAELESTAARASAAEEKAAGATAAHDDVKRKHAELTRLHAEERAKAAALARDVASYKEGHGALGDDLARKQAKIVELTKAAKDGEKEKKALEDELDNVGNELLNQAHIPFHYVPTLEVTTTGTLTMPRESDHRRCLPRRAVRRPNERTHHNRRASARTSRSGGRTSSRKRTTSSPR